MTTYAAHIITTDAHALGDPEITITTDASEDIPVFVAGYTLNEGDDIIDVLTCNGWRVIGDMETADEGYFTATVEAVDAPRIVTHITFERAQADTEYQRQDGAWRTMIRDAMLDGGSATTLAQAANLSRERVYQIRDGRR